MREDLIQQEFLQPGRVLQKLLEPGIGNGKLEGFDPMVGHRNPEAIFLLHNLHLSIRAQMKKTEQVELFPELSLQLGLFQNGFAGVSVEKCALNLLSDDVRLVDNRGGRHTHGDADSFTDLLFRRPVLNGLLNMSLQTSLAVKS